MKVSEYRKLHPEHGIVASDGDGNVDEERTKQWNEPIFSRESVVLVDDVGPKKVC